MLSASASEVNRTPPAVAAPPQAHAFVFPMLFVGGADPCPISRATEAQWTARLDQGTPTPTLKTIAAYANQNSSSRTTRRPRHHRVAAAYNAGNTERTMAA